MARTVSGPGNAGRPSAAGRPAGEARQIKNTARKSTGGRAPRQGESASMSRPFAVVAWRALRKVWDCGRCFDASNAQPDWKGGRAQGLEGGCSAYGPEDRAVGGANT
jgi:hypothetical protein